MPHYQQKIQQLRNAKTVDQLVIAVKKISLYQKCAEIIRSQRLIDSQNDAKKQQ